MSSSKTNVQNHPGSYSSYISGFVLSIIFTLAAFGLAERDIYSNWTLAIAISILAVGQLLIQVIFFLHLGREKKPRWNLFAFLFMILVVFIVVVGSLWIMHNLDYHHPVPDVDTEIMQEENIYR